jgi:uncharacterized repeat protein (TIGR01451 family)
MKYIWRLGVVGVLLWGAPMMAKQPKKSEAKTPPPVSVTSQSYQMVAKKTKGKNGKIKTVTKWVRATRVVPGTVVKYVDTVTNNTDKPLSDVAIKNPINPHLTYVAGSATSETNATILYSIDGGKHFDAPDKLMIKDLKTGKKRIASPKEYNAIQWTIASVPPESNTTVEFRAKLK